MVKSCAFNRDTILNNHQKAAKVYEKCALMCTNVHSNEEKI
jgi:hypothetical protein